MINLYILLIYILISYAFFSNLINIRFPLRIFSPTFIYLLFFLIFILVNITYNIYFRNSLPPAHVIYDKYDFSNFLLFIFVWLVFFVIGVKSYKPSKSVKYKSTNLKFTPRTIAFFILGVECITLFVYVYATGDLTSFITNHRESVYQGQWGENSAVFNNVRIISGYVFLGSAFFAGILQGLSIKKYGTSSFLYILLIIPGTLVKAALLSRGVFLLWVIYWLCKIVTLREFKKRNYVYFLFLFLLILSGILFGIDQRNQMQGDSGIAIEESINIIINTGFNGVTGVLNSFMIANNNDSVVIGFATILKQINPMPGFLIKSNDYVNNLTTLLFGVTEGSSMPMPFIGEVYYNLGYMFLIIPWLQGLWCAFIESRVFSQNNDFPGYIILLLYGATLHWFLYMPHSGIRATTRLLIWLLVIVLVKQLYFLVKRTNNKGRFIQHGGS